MLSKNIISNEQDTLYVSISDGLKITNPRKQGLTINPNFGFKGLQIK